MPAKFLMVQGTGSHVGKSVLVAALCRIFADRGVRVAPFKAQNMALNSAVTPDGLEVGRSTAVQAQAARTGLRVEMNPILLKPKAETVAQMMLLGRPYADVSAIEPFQGRTRLKEVKLAAIRQSLEVLSEEFDLIIMEGAGSPVEVNLREWDVVNMAVARMTGAPVMLAADIDRGGAIAALVGTWELLEEPERRQVCGFIFNKFRGDRRLLEPAIEFLHRRTGCPTLGVIPFDPGLSLMEEDSLRSDVLGTGDPEIEIAVVAHRHLSNFTDLDPLAIEPGVLIRYVRTPAQLGCPDAILIPGTKNTINDLRMHYQSGLAARILKHASEGTPILGICGGYQMLGKALFDPQRVESDHGDLDGLGLLDVVTEFRPEKMTKRVSLRPAGPFPFLVPFPSGTEQCLQGYEIHAGEPRPLHAKVHSAFLYHATSGKGSEGEGAVSQNGLVFGTSVHGLFENDGFRRRFVNVLRESKGLIPLPLPLLDYQYLCDREFERWARWVEDHIDWSSLGKIL